MERSPSAHVDASIDCRRYVHGHHDRQGDAQVAMDWGQPGSEPRVEEMVSDPIVQLVMRRDRVTLAQVMATVIKARARLQADRPNEVATPPPA